MLDFVLPILVFAGLFACMALRIPIAMSMLLAGLVGTVMITGNVKGVLSQFKSLTYDTFSNYSLSIIPLFLLMGQFAAQSKLSNGLFRSAEHWFGRRKSGVAMATIGTCAGFGAICGSSLATVATVGHIALPEMQRSGYSGRFASGVLAAGGTLGILIPPSLILIIYAIITEQNIIKMFSAALLPAVLAVIGYAGVIMVCAHYMPHLLDHESSTSKPLDNKDQSKNTNAEQLSWFDHIRFVLPIAIVFLVVIGGIYAGLFTPTESAAVGAGITLIYALLIGHMDAQALFDCLLQTARTTGLIFALILGAAVFNAFLALTQVPQSFAVWIGESAIAPMLILIGILCIYVILGCFMDSLSMILLTIPVFFPVIQTLDFSLSPEETAVWFGILVLIVVEMGLITPPMGLNLFVVRALAPDIPLRETYYGVLPFIISDVIRIACIVLFPSLALGVVRWLF